MHRRSPLVPARPSRLLESPRQGSFHPTTHWCCPPCTCVRHSFMPGSQSPGPISAPSQAVETGAWGPSLEALSVWTMATSGGFTTANTPLLGAPTTRISTPRARLHGLANKYSAGTLISRVDTCGSRCRYSVQAASSDLDGQAAMTWGCRAYVGLFRCRVSCRLASVLRRR